MRFISVGKKNLENLWEEWMLQFAGLARRIE